MSLLNKNDEFTIKEPIFEIWTKPKKTFTWLFANDPKKYQIPLLILSGISIVLNNSLSKSSGEGSLLYTLIAFSIIGGGVFGWLSLYLYSMILSWTGRWLKGKADTSAYLTVIAWSNIPWICSILVWIFKIILWGDQTLQIEKEQLEGLSLYLYSLFDFVLLVLGIWSAVLLLIGITLIQKFTIQKTILNLFLSLIFLAIPGILVAGLIYLAKS